MFTRTLIAACAVAAFACATLANPTAASAKDGRNAAIAVGAIAGLGGALLAASADHNRGFSHVSHRERRHDGAFRSHGFRHDGYSKFGHGRPGYGHGYDHGFRNVRCFEKPITRWSRFEGRPVVVGYKSVCR